MWPVSAKFLSTITGHPHLATAVTVTVPGGSPVTLGFVSGSWTVTAGQLIRRTAAIVIDGGSAVYDLVSAPGAVFRVTHGMQWQTSSELIPIITGELASAATQLGDGAVSLSIADLGQRVQGCAYVQAVSPATTATRVATVTAAVTDAVATTVTSTASDAGTVGVAQTWTDRAQLITDLATDGNAEAFFRPDGTFLIRNVPQITDPPVYTLRTGDGGTITTFARTRPLDKLYNTVVVTPSSLDSSQTWTQIIVQITDTGNPRHPTKIGVRPTEWPAPTIMSAGEAAAAGQVILSKVLGSTETLAVGTVSNAALDAGDVVQVVSPTDTGDETANHLIDSLTGDLTTGEMTIQTRAAAA